MGGVAFVINHAEMDLKPCRAHRVQVGTINKEALLRMFKEMQACPACAWTWRADFDEVS
jgi:hypothetical protein